MVVLTSIPIFYISKEEVKKKVEVFTSHIKQKYSILKIYVQTDNTSENGNRPLKNIFFVFNSANIYNHHENLPQTTTATAKKRIAQKDYYNEHFIFMRWVPILLYSINGCIRYMAGYGFSSL